MWLFFLFVAVPIIEIALFIQVGDLIGLFPTLLIVIATAALGTWLVRGQGLATLSTLRNQVNNFQNPTQPLAHGAMILFAGALLLTPGFFTDGFGFLLLVPRFRDFAFDYLKERIINSASSRQDFVHPNTARYQKERSSDDIIEGEFHEDIQSKD